MRALRHGLVPIIVVVLFPAVSARAAGISTLKNFSPGFSFIGVTTISVVSVSLIIKYRQFKGSG